jgi:hypothetical protein
MSRKAKDKVSKEIKRFWGKVPVVDAVKDLRIFVQPNDLKGAKPGDASACVLAKACKRSVGSDKVLFYRDVAYVEVPTESGETRVERFLTPRVMRDKIEAFDKGEGFIPKAGFTLRPHRHRTNSVAVIGPTSPGPERLARVGGNSASQSSTIRESGRLWAS